MDELDDLKRSLRKLRMQQAQFGGMAPVHILNQIEDTEKEITRVERARGIVRPLAAPVFPRPMTEDERHALKSSQELIQWQKDVAHQVGLLAAYRTNLAHYLRQARAYGSIDLAPLVTLHGVNESRASIRKAKDALKALRINIPSQPDDE